MSEPGSIFHSLIDMCKKILWRIITPVFPYARDYLVKIGLKYHEGRQPYRLGWIRKNRMVSEFLEHAAKRGFANHFVAWIDEGEIYSLRKLENFHWQYHLRIFRDGEIRGHYERTPEAHPIAHFKGDGMEPRREELLAVLDGWISASPTRDIFFAGKTASNRAPAASRGIPTNG